VRTSTEVKRPALGALTLVNAFSREALAIDVGHGIKAEQLVEAMERISSIREPPRPFAWTTFYVGKQRGFWPAHIRAPTNIGTAGILSQMAPHHRQRDRSLP
jgi:hypothetical protein